MIKLQLRFLPLARKFKRFPQTAEIIFGTVTKKFWSGRAPVLFPICGGLKEDKYTFGGSEYTLNKHGFAKLMEFEVEAQGDGYAVFLLKSTPETKKNYPFDFELRIKYALDGDSVHVEYRG